MCALRQAYPNKNQAYATGSLLPVELAIFSSGRSRGSTNQNLNTRQSRDARNLGGTKYHVYDVCRVYGAFLTQLLKKRGFSCRRSELSLSLSSGREWIGTSRPSKNIRVTRGKVEPGVGTLNVTPHLTGSDTAVSWAATQVPETKAAIHSSRKIGFSKAAQVEVLVIVCEVKRGGCCFRSA